MDWPTVSSDAQQQGDDPDPPQAYASGCDLARLVSIREMDALASMVITALPFPPLPLMVLQGTDGEGATASSFDLLKQAIVLQKLKGTHRAPEQIAREKAARLCALQEALQRHCSAPADRESDAWVEGAYRIFGEHFRLFFVENYPTCSRDLRFEPMGSVPRTHLVMQQAASHTRASMIMAAPAAAPASGVENTPAVEFARYEDVVKHYALDLGTLSDS
jgi:hypothetical protein